MYEHHVLSPMQSDRRLLVQYPTEQLAVQLCRTLTALLGVAEFTLECQHYNPIGMGAGETADHGC